MHSKPITALYPSSYLIVIPLLIRKWYKNEGYKEVYTNYVTSLSQSQPHTPPGGDRRIALHTPPRTLSQMCYLDFLLVIHCDEACCH